MAQVLTLSLYVLLSLVLSVYIFGIFILCVLSLDIYLKSYPAMKDNYIVPNKTFSSENALPLRFDWRDKNLVTSVKNQMDVSSKSPFCLAFVLQRMDVHLLSQNMYLWES